MNDDGAEQAWIGSEDQGDAALAVLNEKERDAVLEAENTARRLFDEEGFLTPVALVFGIDEKGHDHMDVIGTAFHTQEGKEGFAKFIRAVAKQHEATLVIFITEAWTVRHQIEGSELDIFKEASHVIPQRDPARREVVYFTVGTRSRQLFGMIPIDRSGPEPTLGATQWEEATTGAVGIFSDLIDRAFSIN